MPNSSNYNNSLDNSLTDNPLASGIPEGGIQELDDILPEIVSEEIAPLEDIPILDETDKLLSSNGILRTRKEETIEIGDTDPLIGETSEDSPAENVSEPDPLTNPIESSDTSEEVDSDTETVQEAIESSYTDETETSPTQADDTQQPLEGSENGESEDSQGEDSDEDESPDAIDSADADNTELPPIELPEFDSGIFTVNGNGEVGVDFLHDGGKFKFELAIFSLEGMEEFWSEDDSTAFIAEAARRAASGSELGHVVISDAAEGAKFSGSLEGGQDWNSGNYAGVKTFQMRPGDTFAMMLVPNGKVSQVLANPEVGGTKRPLFSLATANPDDGLHFGQIADVTGDGNTFVMEDMRIDGRSDRDYNDIIFQIRGATGTAGLLDEAIEQALDWRQTDLGRALIEYAKPDVTPDSPDDGESVDDSDPENPDDGTDGAIDLPVDDGETPSEEVTDNGEEDTNSGDVTDEVTGDGEESPTEDTQNTDDNSGDVVTDESEESPIEDTDTTDDNSEDVVTDEVTGDDGESPIEDTDTTDDNSEDVVTDEVTGDGGESPTDDTQNTDDNSEDVVTDEVTGESGESPTEDTQNTEDHPSPPIEIPDTALPERIEFPRENQPLIGIIDTGFAANNPDIDYSNITLGSDRVNGDDNPLQAPGEGSEHGTHILGIIAAEQDNGVGIDGINDDAPIWVGQAIGSGDWAESLVEFVNAAQESEQPNAVVNLSLDLTQVNPDGSVTTRYELTPKERAAIEYARQNNVLLVVAAGNDGGVMSALGQASQEFDNIITVGSAERVNDELSDAKAHDRASYSSYGQGLDILARGGTDNNPELSLSGESLGTMSGTSVATAKVTGAISQVWAANPELSYRQAIEIVKDTATDLGVAGFDNETGAGLLNSTAAVLLAQATPPEAHFAPPSVIPESWSGEGEITPGERAVATPFKGKYYDWKRYTIRSGDTLSHIAARTMGNGGAPYYNFIAQKNRIANPNRIGVGQKIWIPYQVSRPAPKPPARKPPAPKPPAPKPPKPNHSSVPNPILWRVNASYFNDRPQFYNSGNIFANSMYGSSLVGRRGYTEGNCTWYAHGRLLELGGNRAALQSMWGNANQWHTQISNGTKIVSSPRPGDIAQWTSNGANHVAVVERVNSDGTIVISESHYRTSRDGGGAGTLHDVRTIPASNPTRFLRVPGVRVENGGGVSTPTAPSNTFTGRVIATAGANLRSGPGTNYGIAGSSKYGSTLTFDKSVSGQFISIPSLGTQSDRWYRIAGTNQWISAALVHGSPKSSLNNPSALPGKQMQYIVKPGDTLSGIAQRFLGNGNRWRELQKPNGSRFTDADARSLQVGQSVYIPVSYQRGTGKPVTNPPSSTPSTNSGINWVNFSGTVGPSIGVNLRNSPRNSDRSRRNEPYGKKLEFDGWKYGETLTDMWLGTPDSRWFKVKGTNLWVPSAYIFGNPPSSDANQNGGGAVGNVSIEVTPIEGNTSSPNIPRNITMLDFPASFDIHEENREYESGPDRSVSSYKSIIRFLDDNFAWMNHGIKLSDVMTSSLQASVVAATMVLKGDPRITLPFYQRFIQGKGGEYTANELVDQVKSALKNEIKDLKNKTSKAIENALRLQLQHNSLNGSNLGNIIQTHYPISVPPVGFPIKKGFPELFVIVNGTQKEKLEVENLKLDISSDGELSFSGQILYTLYDDFGFGSDDVSEKPLVKNIESLIYQAEKEIKNFKVFPALNTVRKISNEIKNLKSLGLVGFNSLAYLVQNFGPAEPYGIKIPLTLPVAGKFNI